MIWWLIPMVMGAINSFVSLLSNEDFQKVVALGFLLLVVTDITGIYTFGEFQMEILELYNHITGWFRDSIVAWLREVLGL